METTSPDFDPSLIPDEPARWPAVVGTISIVWASLSVCCMVGFLGMVIFFPGDPNQSPPTEITPLFLFGMGLGVVLAGLLMAAGIAGVTRRPATRPLHLAYAALALLSVIPGVMQQVQAHADMATWANNHPDTDYGKMYAEFGSYFFPIGMVCYSVIALPYPLFCLVWFGLVKRSSAEIRPVNPL